MLATNPAETDATRMTLRPKLSVIGSFIAIFGGIIFALSISIFQISKEIAFYEEAIAEYSQSGIPMMDYINLFQSFIISNRNSIFWLWIFIFICAFCLLVSVTTSIQLSPAGIRWRRFFVIWRSPWTDITRIRPMPSKFLRFYGLGRFYLGGRNPLETESNLVISLVSGREFKIPTDWFAFVWNPLTDQEVSLYTLLMAFLQKYNKSQIGEISTLGAGQMTGEAPLLLSQNMPLQMKVINWINKIHDESILNGTLFPTWEAMVEMYKKEFGSELDAYQMERMYTTWYLIQEQKLKTS